MYAKAYNKAFLQRQWQKPVEKEGNRGGLGETGAKRASEALGKPIYQQKRGAEEKKRGHQHAARGAALFVDYLAGERRQSVWERWCTAGITDRCCWRRAGDGKD
ncbi:hypothetical protein DD570_30830, partial [Klebsiella pneumoniae]